MMRDVALSSAHGHATTLQARSGSDARDQHPWLREVKTHHVQSWLEEIAREHEISKTTLKQVKNFLSGVFRHAAQQGFFDGADPVKLAEVPAFCT
jgi:hypothetical protein